MNIEEFENMICSSAIQQQQEKLSNENENDEPINNNTDT
jgi:hypothetical protein